MIENVDTIIGRFLSELERLELIENTIINKNTSRKILLKDEKFLFEKILGNIYNNNF